MPAADVGAHAGAPRQSTELARQFELTARAAGIGYWSTDAATRTPRWNEQTFRLHGLAPDAPVLPMQAWLERFVHADDRAAVRTRFEAWVASRQPHLEQEFRIVRTDGKVRRLLSHSRLEATPAGLDFYGVLQDVTAQRAAEAALREAGERVALATRAAGIAIWEQDLVSGVAYWDEQMWRLRGLQPQPVAPSMPDRLALLHPDDREPMLAESARAAEEGRLSMVEFRVQWPDGQWRWLASRATVLRDPSGKPVRRVGVNWDITDARSAQLAREQRAIALRESQAKSQFLSRMSHELRTPLNAVLGFTQLLLAGGERLPAETRRRHLEQVEIAGRHLLSLIDDVLDLSSLEGGELRIEPQAVALDALVEQTLPLVAALADRNRVHIRTGKLAGRVQADPTRLRQVLLNLLTNAIKYNHAGGEVWIDSDGHDDTVRLVVADNGRGMDEAQLRQAFEPFNRLGREHEGIEGTGIGLPIVRALVERMGGRLEVTSTPGAGSRFEVFLPTPERAPPSAPAAAAPPPPAAAAARRLREPA
ncbi:MAG: PAS domain-containing protein, partial [Burkholderiales bacterium]|nr:PAS domain-containing protein [Burkholderiales bacterium]